MIDHRPILEGVKQHVSDWQVSNLGLVYVVFISSHSPGHFGNSNPSLSLITHTTHSTSGLGLPEWLICCAFYCSHIVGVVNACVVLFSVVVSAHSIHTSDMEC